MVFTTVAFKIILVTYCLPHFKPLTCQYLFIKQTYYFLVSCRQFCLTFSPSSLLWKHTVLCAWVPVTTCGKHQIGKSPYSIWTILPKIGEPDRTLPSLPSDSYSWRKTSYRLNLHKKRTIKHVMLFWLHNSHWRRITHANTSLWSTKMS